MLAGVDLRPNSSLAGFFGSFGLASGGSGFALTLPLSCALAILEYAAAIAAATSKPASCRIIGRLPCRGESSPRQLCLFEPEIPEENGANPLAACAWQPPSWPRLSA